MKGLALLAFFFSSALIVAQPVSPPASCTATLGSPANGVAHYLDIYWTAVSGATSYDLEYSTDNTTWNLLYSGTSPFSSHNTGSVGNLPFYYRTRAWQGIDSSAWTNATQFPIYTACDNPALPQMVSSDFVSVDFFLPAEVPDSNPGYTVYSIYCFSAGKFVQADGTLDSTEVFQTRADWGIVHVNGLSPSTNYCFYSKARNNDGDIRTTPGSSSSSFESWNSNIIDSSISAPTNQWWSPDTGTYAPVSFFPIGGCPSGSVGFEGRQNGKWKSFLRAPSVNCSGLSQITLDFQLTNSYFVSHPNDLLYFNMWAPTASFPGGTFINATTVNGISGYTLPFSAVRACQNESVVFNLSSVTDKSAILIYVQALCAYDDTALFSFRVDNINIGSGGTATACLATEACSAAFIQTAPTDQVTCINDSTVFSVIVGGNVVSYQWQESVNDGSTWSDLTEGGNYAQVNSAQLKIVNVALGMSGRRYRCSVTDTCSAVLVTPSAKLTVNPMITATGNITGAANVCRGQNSVLYTVPAVTSATTYTWTLPNGVNIATGDLTDSIFVNFSDSAINGVIQVVPSNSCEQGPASQVFPVVVSQIPDTPQTINGNLNACRNTVQTYSVPAVNGASYYIWTIPGSWSGSSFADTIHPTIGASGGNITVAAGNNCGNSPPFSLSVNVVTSVPSNPPLINGADSICAHASQTYFINRVPGADSYIWTLPTGWSGTSQDSSITVIDSSLSGNIQVTAVNACGSSSSTIKHVTVVPAPSIVFTPLDTSCQGDLPMQLNNASPTGGTYSGPGVSNNTFSPSLAGLGTHLITYTVSNTTGCSSTDTTQITVRLCNLINELSYNQFAVFPNPFTNELIVQNYYDKEVKMQMMDALGNEIYRVNIAPNATGTLVTTPYSSGVYFLKIIASEKPLTTRKLIKLH